MLQKINSQFGFSIKFFYFPNTIFENTKLIYCRIKLKFFSFIIEFFRFLVNYWNWINFSLFCFYIISIVHRSASTLYEDTSRNWSRVVESNSDDKRGKLANFVTYLNQNFLINIDRNKKFYKNGDAKKLFNYILSRPFKQSCQ